MRLTIPIDVWDPRRGGAERYLWWLARSLTERGHEVVVVCWRRTSEECGPARVVVPRLPAFPRWRRELLFARRAQEVHRREGCDLLFAVRHALAADVYQPHGGSYLAAAEAALLALPAGRRLLRRLARRLRPTYRLLCRLDGEVFARSPGLLTLSLSRFVEEGFRRWHPDVPFRFERLYNGIPLESFHDRDREERSRELRRRFGIPRESRLALFLGNRFRQKGLETAVRALASSPRWHLVAGGRDRPGAFSRLAGLLGVAGRLHFAGTLADARAAYSGADAFVLPTYYDPCSLSTLESLACGTPVVTTRSNGASELMVQGREGYILSSPEDAAALAAALKEIDAHWEPLHAAALESSRRFSWEEHVDRVESVLARRRGEKQGGT